MSAWVVPTTGPNGVPPQWTDFSIKQGTFGGSALTVDATDPNTTPPDASRVTVVPRKQSGNPSIFIVSDTVVTVEGWWYSLVFGKWFRAFSQATPGAMTAVAITTGIPFSVPFYLRLATSANAATIVGAMFQGEN